jgi:hypothetical protein
MAQQGFDKYVVTYWDTEMTKNSQGVTLVAIWEVDPKAGRK